MLGKSETISPEICQVCWEGGFESEHASITYRGPWLKHRGVLCDRRKMYECSSVTKQGHCACDGFSKLEHVRDDTYTTTYGGVHHSIKEVSLLNKLPEHWDRVVIETLKKEGRLDSKMELLWSAVLYSSSIPAHHFGVDISEINRLTSLTAKMELAANRVQWEEVRDELLENWTRIEATIDGPLAAVARRQLSEYICGRSQARIAFGHAFNIGHIQINYVGDALLRQMLGGSWCGMTYLCFEGFHTKHTPSLSRAGYVDACGSTVNSWASIHRDLSTSTENNAIHYYSGEGMSRDLLLVLDSCLHLDGAGVRSSLTLLDLNDQNSRYKFMENYWHCRAEGYSRIDRAGGQLSKRLSPLYGIRKDEPNTSVDVFNYIFSRESNNQESSFEIKTQRDALLHSMKGCLSVERDIEVDYKNMESMANKMIEIQHQLKKASDAKDHLQISSLSLEYRNMKMDIWARELRGELPFGSALAVTYMLICWFMEHMDDVDSGYRKLLESKFVF
ncbi:hypothetical protein DSO57_1035681 [Entomophthora muscae]|uniref:Uncharacterized protein n=1 Tax=Entomophthora muscae TaxID=34485 RepID=A0ACC2TA87_9FUNG|nr:hypothetical protein DSO57_1035681 [Entomophthora muscae]